MKRQTLSFDDVLLVPQYSDIESRAEVDLSRELGKTSLNLPIISSPMDTVTEVDMSLAMAKCGGLGIIHRYNTIEEQSAMVRTVVEGGAIASAAVGATGDYIERSIALVESGARVLCIDVAHGFHKLVEKSIKSIKDKFGDNVSVIAGNVATPKAYRALSDWGADAVRIGIGGGSICSTRIQTGHGVPTFESVLTCCYEEGAAIIADGGIRTAGDVVKAYAAGADFVMLGSMLAGTKQSPGQVFNDNQGKKYKVYRGMASVEAQKDWRGEARSLEGISTTIPYKGSVESILSDLRQNIKSGLSYSGARNITQLQAKSEFILQSNASQTESSTHILVRR